MNKEQVTNNKQIVKRRFLLAAALPAVFLLVLAGCKNPFDLPDHHTAGGNGTFTLTIGGLYAGRTILPAVVQSDFALYRLVFSSDGMEDVPVERTSANSGEPVPLTAATWNLTVTAYFDIAKTRPAARGSLEEITISDGSNIAGSVELFAIIEAGAEGTFNWIIDYPDDVTSASMAITPLDTETGSAARTYYFLNGIPAVDKNNSDTLLPLNTGYYRVLFSLSNGKVDTGMEEYMHIYKNMESRFEYTFTRAHFMVNSVTNGEDSGPGSLRYAITNAADNSTIYIEYIVETIALTDRLQVSKNLTIEGSSVIITRGGSWTAVDNSSQLLYISDNAEVNIRRVHFKDGRATNNGGAINNRGNLTLESCIFSGSQTSSDYDNGGGAIYNNYGSLVVRGCTFYGNSSEHYGGAIYSYSGTLTLAGNLFYENTAPYYPVVYSEGNVNSIGYNVVDIPLGTGADQTGWSARTGDITFAVLSISGIPFNISSFEPVTGLGIIPYRPASFPVMDFYGKARTYSPPGTPGAAAAVVEGTVTVTFYTNGATSGTRPAAQTASTGAVIILPDDTEFSKDGYVFGGWNTEADGTGDNYSAGDYTVTGNIFLYVRWVIIPVAEDFTINGVEAFTYDGTVRTVNISANPGKSPGAITVYYNGTTEEPVNAGTYTVTFDVDETPAYGAVTGLPAGTLIINPKPVTITGLSAANRAYDGSANAAVTGTAAINGNIDGENLTVVDGTASFADKNAGNGKTVTFSGYALDGTAAPDYELSEQPASVTANITPLRLAMGAPSGSPTKAYDGTTAYTGTGITIGSLTNAVSGDTVDVSVASMTYNSANVADANLITIVYAISGEDADNYLTPLNNTIAAAITKAAGAPADAPTLASKTYNRVTVNAVTPPDNGQPVEYAIGTLNNGTGLSAWQAGTAFTGLNADTTYYVYARSAESDNYGAGVASVSAAITTLQSGTAEVVMYYWVNEQDVLAVTDYEGEGTITIARGQELVITAQDAPQGGEGYTNQQWHLNGVNTGGTGVTYTFSSMVSGKYTVGLFVQKGGKWYNANIAITVE